MRSSSFQTELKENFRFNFTQIGFPLLLRSLSLRVVHTLKKDQPVVAFRSVSESLFKREF